MPYFSPRGHCHDLTFTHTKKSCAYRSSSSNNQDKISEFLRLLERPLQDCKNPPKTEERMAKSYSRPDYHTVASHSTSRLVPCSWTTSSATSSDRAPSPAAPHPLSPRYSVTVRMYFLNRAPHAALLAHSSQLLSHWLIEIGLKNGQIGRAHV